MKKIFWVVVFLVTVCSLYGNKTTLHINADTKMPSFSADGKMIITAPSDGLWSVATTWTEDWMSGWVHSKPVEVKRAGEWTILSGKLLLPQGEMLVRDSYRSRANGTVQCIRRFEWTGKDTLKHATLSVRWKMQGQGLKPLIPGVLYYGNPMGAKINSEVIPVYTATPGEFAIFEDHRYPMPFAMLESAQNQVAAAVHTTPSPVRGGKLADQWWSLGVEAYDGYSEFVLYSGPIGYNGQHSVAKALQGQPMKYSDTYLNLEPGRVIEKEFFVEAYPIERAGSGFQQPIYTSVNIHKPFYAECFPDFEEIVKAKYLFAQSRWIDEGGKSGFGMYDLDKHKELVIGWAGQAASPGFALQRLGNILDDPAIASNVQSSLDFITTFPVNNDGTYAVIYNFATGTYHGGDHVSCGQGLYNIVKAIQAGRKNKKYDTRKWEEFVQTVCDRQAARILADDWNPNSTSEACYIAPLSIASKLFRNSSYKAAAVKAGEVFAGRHLEMNGCYWGGTLDATCEDKEAAWAAFQGFLTLYEQFGEDRFLVWAKHAMDVCLSYVVIWDIPLPAGRMADYHFKTTGWTVVSPQNQHIDVYGVFFAPEVYKMGKILKNDDLQRLAKVMYRSCFQLTDPFGSQGEQLQQTNFAQHGDMTSVHRLRGGYSERWTVFWIAAHFLNAAARFEEMGVRP